MTDFINLPTIGAIIAIVIEGLILTGVIAP